MRVLHFFKTYYPDTFGGIERSINAIAKGTLTYGIQSDVLSLSHHPEQNACEVDGHFAYKAKCDFEIASTGFSRDAITKFAELSARADIVHYHFPWPFMDLVHLLKQHGKPTVLTYHSDIVKQKVLLWLYKPVMHQFLSSVNRIVVTSENYLNSNQVLSKYLNKIKVIPLGLEQADYPQVSANVQEKWRRRFQRPFFLFTGVLRYYKGLHILIDAARNIDADVLIVGEGPMEQPLKAQARQLGVSNVHFLGGVTELEKIALLKLCTAFVFPSHLRSEAYGLSLVEAAMFGKPMISCEINTGTSFVNSANETGIVIAPADSQSLSRAMNTLLRKPLLVDLYGANSSERYQRELTAKLMVERYFNLYNSLI